MKRNGIDGGKVSGRIVNSEWSRAERSADLIPVSSAIGRRMCKPRRVHYLLLTIHERKYKYIRPQASDFRRLHFIHGLLEEIRQYM